MLPSPAATRIYASELATSPAWNELVRPEIDRHLAKYEDLLLNSQGTPDRELADTRTRYHALKDLLRDLGGAVSSSIQQMSHGEAVGFSPEKHAKLTAVFALKPLQPTAAPSPPPVRDPIQYPATPSFNPFASPPPKEDTAGT